MPGGRKAVNDGGRGPIERTGLVTEAELPPVAIPSHELRKAKNGPRIWPQYGAPAGLETSESMLKFVAAGGHRKSAKYCAFPVDTSPRRSLYTRLRRAVR